MNCSAKRRGDENRWKNSEERGEKSKKYPFNVKSDRRFNNRVTKKRKDLKKIKLFF